MRKSEDKYFKCRVNSDTLEHFAMICRHHNVHMSEVCKAFIADFVRAHKDETLEEISKKKKIDHGKIPSNIEQMLNKIILWFDGI